MKIYTKTGDNLTTSIITERVDKDDLRIEVEGTVDELIANLTLATTLNNDSQIISLIKTIIKKLFIVSGDAIGYGKIKISKEDVEEIERTIDEYSSKLPKVNSFIELGTKPSSASIHVARTVCRRFERRMVSLAKKQGVSKEALQYVNRLSDLLFILGRYEEEINV
ncbi:MAG TPA: cob(I)yrinic acid a,c-diamide adenosyltransferase [Bacilli bacterium]|jgi:cob(I)alamin adenosyltransferase|nr:cob(I)yrinic acid a,c-diamide adenosyltransferase [Acholeplasmataceae bacterium]HNZ77829.1 cob(I)yrinic acid a,c-diamide adenosyltransferase [Bacilli bacterium]HOD60902.1 cob(I)yrinic acid a,c-diamide adenosyltransferase [Bacilli bacterium]HOH61064.1 cob(I)yrinic acid a,c-diamide adenosyltransferase [Bacilli bacterium]HPB48722.1 cob(I)yrinic acid a,c-diamide adenosyltransferase [Bacilli bacterium]